MEHSENKIVLKLDEREALAIASAIIDEKAVEHSNKIAFILYVKNLLNSDFKSKYSDI